MDYLPERNKLAGVFRMMTYNIHHGYDYDTAICDGEQELWKTASTIRRNDPDIVAVNEINKGLLSVDGRDCGEENLPRLLASSLEMNYVYCNDYHGNPGVDECGSAVVAGQRNSGNGRTS